MEKRNKLHDYSLLLIFLAILDLFTFVGTVISSLVGGVVRDALAANNAEDMMAVKIMLGVFVALMALLMFAQGFIGVKGLKISRQPSAAKGYIVAAHIFLALSILACASNCAALFEGANVIDTALNLANVILDVIAYVLFIRVAKAVRESVLDRQG